MRKLSKHQRAIASLYKTKIKKVRKKLLKLTDCDKEQRFDLVCELEDSDTNEDLLDVLILDSFTTLQEYYDSVNNHLSLEAKTHEYTLPKYEVGTLKQIMILITNQHRLIALRETIGL